MLPVKLKQTIALVAAVSALLAAGCQNQSTTAAKRAPWGGVSPPAGPPDKSLAATVITAPAPALAPQPVPIPAPPIPRSSLDVALDSPAGAYTSAEAPLSTLFYAIGRAYEVNLNVEHGIDQKYQEHFNRGTLRELIDGIVDANDLYTEEEGGTLYIKRTKIAIYDFSFPNIDRKSKTETSVSLEAAVQNTATASTPSIGTSVVSAGNTTNQSSGGTGETSFSISEDSKDGPWQAAAAEIKEQMVSGEKITLNSAVGRVIVSSTAHRQEFWKQYFDDLNNRMNCQVSVEITLHELQLNNTYQLGVNWTQVQTALNATGGTTGSFSTSTGFSAIAGASLPPATLLGNFATGKLSAALTALQTQGSMKLITDGSVRLLNNQKGFIKVGDDKTFFSLSQSTSLSTTGTATGVGTGTQTFYTQQQETIGFVSPVTAYVSSDHRITLVLEPARTSLNGVDTSPDGTQTAPDVNSSSIGTILRLRDGESAILGGLVQTMTSSQTNGVPFLANLPLIGLLAKTDATNNTRTELLITVSAHLIP
jgi:type II secretory pathway component GspD/PulD (secretin)